ncbi:MAG TPA: RidA family protein [Chitinophagaceae bacterium]|jgi:enamine deaminase RidA (YjgF/YER057c/UK114 family)|nr:RidA family protein [Chitinophagaceae bacterium]
MDHQFINPTGSSYSQAFEASNFKRLLFISGQIPQDAGNYVPEDFRSQCGLVWTNIETQLHTAGMNFSNLVKITVFLSDRKYRQENYEVRAEVLKEHQPALTIIITGIYDEQWLLEIEAIARE